MKRVAPAALIALVALSLSLAQAQTYPARPVRVLSSGGAGGPNDVQTRGLAQFMGERLGQPFVIENRAGAGGMVAGEACVKSPPDGYTVCTFGSGALSWTPVLNEMPYDPIKDLMGIFHMGYIDSIINVHPSVPAQTLGELVALAKAKPGTVTWAAFGLASSGYMYAQWLKKYKGVDVLVIPYKSAIQSQQAVMSGEAMVVIYTASQVVSLAKAGKVRALSVNSDARLPELPNVQTDEEAGFDLPVIRSWFGLMAPVGVPRDIALKLNAEMNRITADPKYADQYMKRLGFRAANQDLDQFNAYLRKNRKDFEDFARELGLKKTKS